MGITREPATNIEEAIRLAFGEAHAGDMKPEMAWLFEPVQGEAPVQNEVEKLVAGAVKSHYGRDTSYEVGQWWRVPVPSPRYDARGLASLIIDVTPYLVASVELTSIWNRSRRHVTVVQASGKPQATGLPLCFLRALLDGDDNRYRIVGKQGPWTSLEIPGLKQPLRLHNEFLDRLRHTFDLKPVADWLDDFGSPGYGLAPLVTGALLGLGYRGLRAPLPAEQQPYSRETIVEVITGLGYGAARARKVLDRIETELGPGITLDEAIRIVLRHIGEEG